MKPLLDLLQAFEAGVFVTLIFGFGIYAGWNLHKSFRPRRITWRRKKFVSTDGVERSGVGAVQPGNRTRPSSMTERTMRTQAELDAISALEQLGYANKTCVATVAVAVGAGFTDFEGIMRFALRKVPQRLLDSVRD